MIVIKKLIILQVSSTIQVPSYLHDKWQPLLQTSSISDTEFSFLSFHPSTLLLSLWGGGGVEARAVPGRPPYRPVLTDPAQSGPPGLVPVGALPRNCVQTVHCIHCTTPGQFWLGRRTGPREIDLCVRSRVLKAF